MLTVNNSARFALTPQQSVVSRLKLSRLKSNPSDALSAKKMTDWRLSGTAELYLGGKL